LVEGESESSELALSMRAVAERFGVSAMILGSRIERHERAAAVGVVTWET